MSRSVRFHATVAFCLGASVLCWVTPLLRSASPTRRAATLPTLTELPPFPEIPKGAQKLSRTEKEALRRKAVDHKLSTYPERRPAGGRVGKFTSTGLFSSFEPTEEQIARLAPHYDAILIAGYRSHLVPIFKKYHPAVKAFLYIDSGLSPDSPLNDAGNVDEENTAWVVKNHPGWILKDARGRSVQSTRPSWARTGEYWPDPGSAEWQNYFAQKLNKLLERTGGVYDAVILDQFLGYAAAHERYAGATRQTNYRTDREFQDAQIRFLKAVCPQVRIPIVPNVDPPAIQLAPEFFTRVVETAGGAENEGLPHENSDVRDYSYVGEEILRVYLDLIRKAPRSKHIRLNSKPGGLAGDVDRTITAYCTYLLVAAPDREVYWTFKEGDSDIPHYWYREFDLDLGAPQADYADANGVLSREFVGATVAVNPGKEARDFAFHGTRLDVLGRPVANPVRLAPHTGMILVKDKAVLTRTGKT